MDAYAYLPPGLEAPPHLDPGAARLRCTAAAGPAELPPGGMLIGGALDPTDAWLETPEGWYLRACAVEPACLRRAVVLQQQRAVELQGRAWLVPELLAPDFSIHPQLITRLPALDAQGHLVVHQQIAHEDLALRLQRLMKDIAENSAADMDDTTWWSMATEILALGYHLSAAEVALWQLMRDDDPLTVCLAAAGHPVLEQEL